MRLIGAILVILLVLTVMGIFVYVMIGVLNGIRGGVREIFGLAAVAAAASRPAWPGPSTRHADPD